jgi:hypothetical protein
LHENTSLEHQAKTDVPPKLRHVVDLIQMNGMTGATGMTPAFAVL